MNKSFEKINAERMIKINNEKIERTKMLRNCLLKNGYEQAHSVMSSSPNTGGIFFRHKESGRWAVIRPTSLNYASLIRIEMDPAI